MQPFLLFLPPVHVTGDVYMADENVFVRCGGYVDASGKCLYISWHRTTNAGCLMLTLEMGVVMDGLVPR